MVTWVGSSFPSGEFAFFMNKLSSGATFSDSESPFSSCIAVIYFLGSLFIALVGLIIWHSVYGKFYSTFIFVPVSIFSFNIVFFQVSEGHIIIQQISHILFSGEWCLLIYSWCVIVVCWHFCWLTSPSGLGTCPILSSHCWYIFNWHSFCIVFSPSFLTNMYGC